MQQWFYAQAGRQQGPVSIEELRRLASQGLISLESTLVWREGMNQWSHARDVAEVAALFPATSAIPIPSALTLPSSEASATPAPFFGPRPGTEPTYAAPPVSAAPRFSFSNAYAAAATTLSQHFGKIFVSVLVVLTPSLISQISGTILTLLTKNYPPELKLIAALLSLIFLLCMLCIATFFQLGQARFIIQLARGQKPSFSTLLGEGKNLMPFLWTSTISGLAIFLGFLCFFLPGIYIALRLMFITQVSIDEGLSGMAAIKRTFELTKGHTVSLLMICLMSIAIFLFGSITVIGLIWILPFMFCLPNIGYLLLRGEKPVTQS